MKLKKFTCTKCGKVYHKKPHRVYHIEKYFCKHCQDYTLVEGNYTLRDKS